MNEKALQGGVTRIKDSLLKLTSKEVKRGVLTEVVCEHDFLLDTY